MIRFGIIGTNWITESFIEAASQIEDFSITAVYSRTMERAKEFANQYNAELTFTNLEEMAKSDQLDAVYIASPNSLHAEQSILFLNNGKHVLCEKPLASNSKEASAMIEAAKDNNVLLMEAMKTTFVPNYLHIKKHLHKLGKVRRYFANYCQYSSRYDLYKEGNIKNAFKVQFSNGALMDLGIYCIYPMVDLFGEPMELKANGYMLDSGVDGEGSIIFSYDEMEGVVTYSKISNSHIPSEIQGENGSLVIDKISTPSKVMIHYNNGTIEDISVPQIVNTMYYEVKEFMKLIKNGQTESSINSYRTSLITAKLLEEARKQIGLSFPADEKS